MTEPAPLSDRQAAILRAVCRDYVVHGGEVSSKALVRAHGFRCSSATLRQELSALERAGLVRRPHRSAGCAPTRAGLSYFVAELQAGPAETPRADVARAVDQSLRELRELRGGPRQGMRAAVCVLSEVSGCLAVTFVGGEQHDRVRSVELVPLVGGRMLAVVEMEGGATHMHTVGLESVESLPNVAASASAPVVGPSGEAPAAIQRLRSELRRLCTGRTLPEAREEVLRRMAEREARVDRILSQALALGLILSSVGPIDPLWLQMAGGPMLARGGVDAARLGDVLALLEDDQRLAEVLSQLVGDAGGEQAPRAHVHVGAGGLLQPAAKSPDDAAADAPEDGPTLTLVGCPVPLAGGGAARATRGAVALIGPDRMDYASVIPLVEYAARALAATIEA
ncbi:MAG: hypothetical protein AAF721_36725 [Myxococcota bacterium]